MEITRRSLLTGASALALSAGSAEAGSFAKFMVNGGGGGGGGAVSMQPLSIGDGGQFNFIDVATDGTTIAGADVFGLYLLNKSTYKWTQLMTSSRFESAAWTTPISGTGAYSARVCRSNSQIIYVVCGQLTGGSGSSYNAVWVSTDHGGTFVRCGTLLKAMDSNGQDASHNLYRELGHHMDIDPNNTDRVILSTVFEGTWTTINGTLGHSATWSQIAAIPANDATWGIGVVAIDGAGPVASGKSSYAYVAVSNSGLYATHDGGANWALVSGSPTFIARLFLGYDGNGTTPSTLFVQDFDTSAQWSLKLYKLTWSGTTPSLTDITPSMISLANNNALGALVCDPSNANHITAFAWDANGSGNQAYVQDSTNKGGAWATANTTFPTIDTTAVPWHGVLRSPFPYSCNISGIVADPASSDMYAISLQSLMKTTYPIASIATCTISIASPAVITQTAHGLTAGRSVSFETTGALPTGFSVQTTYYVISAGLTANTFELSATVGGSAINTSGTQSGTHTLYQGQPFVDISVGTEEAVCMAIIIPPSGGGVIHVACEDIGVVTVTNAPNAPPSLFYNTIAFTKPAHCIDYASSDPTFAVASFGGLFGGAGGTPGIGKTANLGTTWSLTSSNPNVYNGGIAASSPNNIIVQPSSGQNIQYTLNGGSSWSVISGPPADGGDYIITAFTGNSRICADRVNYDTGSGGAFYMQQLGGVGSPKLWKTINGGAAWGTGVAATLTDWTAGVAYAGNLKSVPGNAGHMFTCAWSGSAPGYSPGIMAFSRIIDSSATNTPSLTLQATGLTNVFDFGFGKAAVGKTYPAIYAYGYNGSTLGLWRSIDTTASTIGTWQQLTNSFPDGGQYPDGWIDSTVAVAASMDTYGLVCCGNQGSTAEYGVFP